MKASTKRARTTIKLKSIIFLLQLLSLPLRFHITARFHTSTLPARHASSLSPPPACAPVIQLHDCISSERTGCCYVWCIYLSIYMPYMFLCSRLFFIYIYIYIAPPMNYGSVATHERYPFTEELETFFIRQPTSSLC